MGQANFGVDPKTGERQIRPQSREKGLIVDGASSPRTSRVLVVKQCDLSAIAQGFAEGIALLLGPTHVKQAKIKAGVGLIAYRCGDKGVAIALGEGLEGVAAFTRLEPAKGPGEAEDG